MAVDKHIWSYYPEVTKLCYVSWLVKYMFVWQFSVTILEKQNSIFENIEHAKMLFSPITKVLSPPTSLFLTWDMFFSADGDHHIMWFMVGSYWFYGSCLICKNYKEENKWILRQA